VLAKVRVGGSSILVTSYGMQGLPPLSIVIEQVDGRPDPPDKASVSGDLLRPPTGSMPIPSLAEPAPTIGPAPQYAAHARRRVPLNIDAHISMIGDVTFSDTDWVGAISERLPLEAFRVRSLERLADGDIEYMGLTIEGVETPWRSGGDLCGVRGQAAALTGLAFRMKGDKASLFDCTYTARFGSGVTVGPLTQGIPARGSGPDDFLVGFQLMIVETSPNQRVLTDGSDPAGQLSSDRISRPIGPRFSTFREEIR